MPSNNKKQCHNNNKISCCGFLKSKEMFILVGEGNQSKSQVIEYLNTYNDWLVWKKSKHIN